MTLKTYQDWIKDGRVWHPALPIFEIASHLRLIKGAIIGTLGDTRHLEAQPPEDHTPFSHTGWPVASPYPYVHALDYGGTSWEVVCDYFIMEARHGHTPWAKYINNGRGVEYRHQDGFTIGHPNPDAGHMHLSIRSDWTHKSIGIWNPLPPSLRPSGDVPVASLPVLKSGSSGQPVRNAQGLLNAHGLRLTIDGSYGPATLGAVKTYQTKVGLTADGEVGTKTWTKLLGL